MNLQKDARFTKWVLDMQYYIIMKEIEIKRSFWQILIRFFEPTKHFKKVILITVIPVIISTSSTIYLVNVIKDITNELEKWVFSWRVKELIIIFIIIAIINYIVMIVGRKYEWAFMPTSRKFFYRYYLNKFLYLNNSDVEKQWTWQLIALIDKWFHKHCELLDRFFSYLLWSFLTIIFSLILIYSINIYYSSN